MNQLTLNPVGQYVVGLVRRRCRPTGALTCVWTARRAVRETASPVPLRRAS